MPNLFVLEAFPRQDLKVETVLLTDCKATWGQKSELTYMLLKAVFLYMIPLFFMSVAYYQIVKVLWSQEIPGHNESSYQPAAHRRPTYSTRSSYFRGTACQSRVIANNDGAYKFSINHCFFYPFISLYLIITISQIFNESISLFY
jgi:hypothetical protein